MIRNLKALGLALVAVFAMSAIVVSAASAQFESEAASTELSVTSNETQKFQYVSGGITVECNTITVTSTVTGTQTTDVKAVPKYTNCKEILSNPIEIDFNSCYYTFTLAKSSTTGTSHIECEKAGDSVTVTIGTNGSFCKLHIGPQTDLGGSVGFSTVGAGTSREIKLHPTVTGVDATRTGSILCGAASSTTGTYNGDVTVKGTSGGKQVGIFVD